MRKALVLLVTFFLGAAAAAQTSPRDEARAHFAAGESRFKAGDYRGAITEFRAADRLVPSPILTYNVALCYDKLGDTRQAAALYKQYLDRRPDAPNRAQVEQRLGALAAAAPQVAPVPVAPVPVAPVPQPPAAPVPPPPAVAPTPGVPDGDGLTAPQPPNEPRRRPYDDSFARRLPARGGDAQAAPGVAPPPPIAPGPPVAPQARGEAEQAPPEGSMPPPNQPEPGAPPPTAPPAQPPPPPQQQVSAEAKHDDGPIYTKWYFWVPVGVVAVLLIDAAVHAGGDSKNSAKNPSGLVLFHF